MPNQTDGSDEEEGRRNCGFNFSNAYIRVDTTELEGDSTNGQSGVLLPDGGPSETNTSVEHGDTENPDENTSSGGIPSDTSEPKGGEKSQDGVSTANQDTDQSGEKSPSTASTDSSQHTSTPSDLTQTTVSDPLFSQREGIFRNKEMVRIGWVPDGDRIVGRDEYISEVADLINDSVFGGSPSHVSITGKTGTGKSLVSRYVVQRAQKAAVEDIHLGTAYVDCSKSSSETQVISTLGQQLNDASFYASSEDDGIDMPDSGLPTDKFYQRLWGILDYYDSVLCILDEIDMLNDDRVLRNLSKAVESGETDCRIGIITLSNVVDYYSDLNPRTKSSYQPRELTFNPYNADKLQEILKGRTDAFRDGVLTDDVIPLTAALSAQEHGDARKAMRLFRRAGEIAEKEQADKVREEHVREAQDKIAVDRFEDFLANAPQQMKAAVLVVCSHAKYSDDEFSKTLDLYDSYQELAQAIDMETIGLRRFRDILHELEMSRVTESKEVNYGKDGGRHNIHRLRQDPVVIQEILTNDSRFDNIPESKLFEWH